MMEDSSTGEMDSTPVRFVQIGLDFFLSEACKEYGEGKEFKESSTDGVSTYECEVQFTIFISSNVCDPVEGSDQCPASCQESLDTLDTACSVDGATISGEPYQASTNLATALIFVDEPCKSVVGDEVLSQVDDTCQDWGALYLSTAIFFCSGDNDTAVCSPFCQGVLDGFYRSCAVDDEVMMEDSSTGEMDSTPVSQIRSNGESKACKEYGE